MRWVWLLSLLFIFSFQLKAEDRSYYRILEQLYNASNEQEWNRAMVQFQGWIHNEYQRSKMSMSEEEFTKRNMDKMTQEIDKRDKKAEEAEKNKTAAPPLQPKQQQQAAATKPTTLVKQSPQGTPTTPAPTVRPPSRMAKRRPSSMAMGLISLTVIDTLSPGITISLSAGSSIEPVTSVVRK
jgi:hypothetical protein